MMQYRAWCHYVPYQVLKLELFIIFEASKGQNYMTRTQSNKKSATLHVYNISYMHCNVRCENALVSCCQCFYHSMDIVIYKL